MHESSKHEPSKQGATVLLLDDNLMTSLRLRAQLLKLGCAVIVASSLHDQSTLEPALVIINLGSRTMNGVALVRASQSTFGGVPIAGFCGHKEIEIRRDAKAAGIDRLWTNENVVDEAAKWLNETATPS